MRRLTFHGRDQPKSAARMPSLSALRAFEAVGRLLSYQRAASELHVTPSAVSHQIKALESCLGVALLCMVNRRLSLTAAGDKYFPHVSQSLRQLSVATTALRQSKGARVLRVTVAPTIATWWLIPKLDRFLAAFPDVSLDVLATTVGTDFALGQFDVAIRYSRRIQNGLHATALGKNECFPVCSPLLMSESFPLRKVADLQHHALINTRDERLVEEPIGNWDGWLKTTNHATISGARQIYLSPRNLTLQAVAQGLGVGLARTLLAAEAMASGQLICPFGPALPLSANYYIVCPESSAQDPDIVAFRDWLLAEAAASAALIKIPRA